MLLYKTFIGELFSSRHEHEKVGMQTTHLLLAFHADFSFPVHPIFELKWSILLSS